MLLAGIFSGKKCALNQNSINKQLSVFVRRSHPKVKCPPIVGHSTNREAHMPKYTRELKLFISKQGSEGKSSRDLAKQFDINSRLIRYWVTVYEIHGEQSFLPEPQSKYASYRLNALKLMWTNGWSINQTSAILNLSSSSAVSRWLQRFNENGIRGLKGKTIENSPMTSSSNTTNKSDDEMSKEELKEELAYLRAEMAVLKKYEELEQKKREQTKKKRRLF